MNKNNEFNKIINEQSHLLSQIRKEFIKLSETRRYFIFKDDRTPFAYKYDLGMFSIEPYDSKKFCQFRFNEKDKNMLINIIRNVHEKNPICQKLFTNEHFSIFQDNIYDEVGICMTSHLEINKHSYFDEKGHSQLMKIHAIIKSIVKNVKDFLSKDMIKHKEHADYSDEQIEIINRIRHQIALVLKEFILTCKDAKYIIDDYEYRKDLDINRFKNNIEKTSMIINTLFNGDDKKCSTK